MSEFREKIQRFTDEVWNKKNFDVFEQMISSNFTYHDPVSPTINNKKDYKLFIQGIQTRSPNMNYKILDTISENKKVVTLYSWSGTPVVEMAGIKPSGKKLEHKGIAIYYFEGDVVEKLWDVWDFYSALKQLGAI